MERTVNSDSHLPVITLLLYFNKYKNNYQLTITLEYNIWKEHRPLNLLLFVSMFVLESVCSMSNGFDYVAGETVVQTWILRNLICLLTNSSGPERLAFFIVILNHCCSFNYLKPKQLV